MRGSQKHTDRRDSVYRIRIMACVIASEVLAIGFFTLWPILGNTNQTKQKIDFSNEAIALEDVVMTRQQNTPAAPPKPQVPVPVPNDKVIEDEIITLDDINITEYSDSLSMAVFGNQGESDEPVSSPQTSPSVIRIMEPTVPDAAKKANIKAEIWVTFLVDQQGTVEEASISQIKLYDRKTGEVKNVNSIDYGLTEATLNAALQWKFRPAKNNGKAVKAYTRQIFTYGF